MALGGAGGSGGDWGGTGTVFVEENINGTARTRLYLNSQNIQPPKPFILTETHPWILYQESAMHSYAPFAFDEITLEQGVGYVNNEALECQPWCK